MSPSHITSPSYRTCQSRALDAWLERASSSEAGGPSPARFVYLFHTGRIPPEPVEWDHYLRARREMILQGMEGEFAFNAPSSLGVVHFGICGMPPAAAAPTPTPTPAAAPDPDREDDLDELDQDEDEDDCASVAHLEAMLDDEHGDNGKTEAETVLDDSVSEAPSGWSLVDGEDENSGGVQQDDDDEVRRSQGSKRMRGGGFGGSRVRRRSQGRRRAGSDGPGVHHIPAPKPLPRGNPSYYFEEVMFSAKARRSRMAWCCLISRRRLPNLVGREVISSSVVAL
ncbi:hypothetical protein C8R46DRAFT_1032765 [Mycena filopes]|nr:hypothetical protein C8R46DRAFT_1032765 [Mycena filopes]